MRGRFRYKTPLADGSVYLHTRARAYANMNIQSEHKANISGASLSRRCLVYVYPHLAVCKLWLPLLFLLWTLLVNCHFPEPGFIVRSWGDKETFRDSLSSFRLFLSSRLGLLLSQEERGAFLSLWKPITFALRVRTSPLNLFCLLVFTLPSSFLGFYLWRATMVSWNPRKWILKVEVAFPKFSSNPEAEGQAGKNCFSSKALCKRPRSSDLSRSRKELYRELVVGTASDPLVERLGWSLEEIYSQ